MIILHLENGPIVIQGDLNSPQKMLSGFLTLTIMLLGVWELVWWSGVCLQSGEGKKWEDELGSYKKFIFINENQSNFNARRPKLTTKIVILLTTINVVLVVGGWFGGLEVVPVKW